MRTISRRMALCIALAVIPLAAQDPTPRPLDLTSFENFATKPNAKITWSKETGRIDTDQARAIITAVVVKDASQPATLSMRGIRIDISSPSGAADQLFFTREVAEVVINSLEEISTHAEPALARMRTASKCFGSAAFRDEADQGVHVMRASQCVMGDGWSGLSVYTGRGTFRFTDTTPAPFLQALDDALRALATAPSPKV